MDPGHIIRFPFGMIRTLPSSCLELSHSNQNDRHQNFPSFYLHLEIAMFFCGRSVVLLIIHCHSDKLGHRMATERKLSEDNSAEAELVLTPCCAK